MATQSPNRHVSGEHAALYQSLQRRKLSVNYRKLDDRVNRGRLSAELEAAVKKLKSQKWIVTQPGEWRVRDLLILTAKKLKVEFEIREDLSLPKIPYS